MAEPSSGVGTDVGLGMGAGVGAAGDAGAVVPARVAMDGLAATGAAEGCEVEVARATGAPVLFESPPPAALAIPLITVSPARP